MEPAGISMEAWKQALESQESRDIDLILMASSMEAISAPCKVLIDCTASDVVPEQYFRFMSAGCHIITPNKKMGAGPWERHQQLQQLQQSTGKMFLGEVRPAPGVLASYNMCTTPHACALCTADVQAATQCRRA